jgi:dihydrodipicolinate synthase/N-acetylneuraminate lyase
METDGFDPLSLLRPRRKIVGMSAVLLPFTDSGAVDWGGFERHLARTVDAGLTPAVNMDTGFAALLRPEERRRALQIAQNSLHGAEFIAGAFVSDQPGDPFNLTAYRASIEEIEAVGGTPILFPSYGMNQQDGSTIVASFEAIADKCRRFYAFELGEMFLPSGRIYPLNAFERLLQIPNCIGLKHSSLRRDLEWARLMIRDRVRPHFRLLTGNDLAIDMVMYGSDYLLGLSTLDPRAFAKRDASWEAGDSAFYKLNDLLQYLGFLAFRAPTPAYRHTAAQFLKLRGWITCDATHPESPQRPESDLHLLRDIAERLIVLTH